MSGLIDLHLHTTCSDGALPPETLVAELAEAGVTVFAVTDHDTVAGVAPARAAAEPLGLRIIPGAEMSVVHRGQDLHILAYFLDGDDPDVAELLHRVRASRFDRMREMVARLNGLGIPVSLDAVVARAADRLSVGRVHLAEELVDRKWVDHYRDVFRYYLSDRGPAHVPKLTADAAETLQVLRRSGAVPVLAHPGAYVIDGLLEELVPAGLLGLEVYHPSHSTAQQLEYRDLAKEWGLVVTGGSDFHGRHENEARPGSLGLEESIVEALENCRDENR